MQVEIKEVAGVLTGVFAGRLDTAAADQCNKDMQPLFENASKELCLDCKDLEYISSSGLRLFLSLRKEVGAKGGKLIVANLNDEVHNVFNLTGFAKLFEIR